MKRKVFIIAALSLVFALSAALLAGCSSVKEKSEFVTENCFKFVDGDEVGYYNEEGVLVYQRPARPEEKSPNVFRLQRTGTNG